MVENSNDYYWLSILTDRKLHDFNEILYFRWNLNNRKESLRKLFTKFKKMLEYGWIKCDNMDKPFYRRNFMITDKGFEYFEALKTKFQKS
jgi:hypothetical protein